MTKKYNWAGRIGERTGVSHSRLTRESTVYISIVLVSINDQDRFYGQTNSIFRFFDRNRGDYNFDARLSSYEYARNHFNRKKGLEK